MASEIFRDPERRVERAFVEILPRTSFASVAAARETASGSAGTAGHGAQPDAGEHAWRCPAPAGAPAAVGHRREWLPLVNSARPPDHVRLFRACTGPRRRVDSEDHRPRVDPAIRSITAW
jgi:hypothetical protein